MKRIVCLLLIFVISVSCGSLFSACNSNINNSHNENEITNKQISEEKKQFCLEPDCSNEAVNSDYCSNHNEVYEHEREFYPEAQRIISSLNNEFAYSVTQNYKLKEIVVSYKKPTLQGQSEYDLCDYYLTFYIYYEINGMAKFAKYDEYLPLLGITPKIEACSESTYNSYRRTAMGGSNSSLYHTKLRSNHYENKSSIYKHDEFFIVNFEDYKKQGYSM